MMLLNYRNLKPLYTTTTPPISRRIVDQPNHRRLVFEEVTFVGNTSLRIVGYLDNPRLAARAFLLVGFVLDSRICAFVAIPPGKAGRFGIDIPTESVIEALGAF